MNYCENCGKKREDNERFCPECGTKYEETEGAFFPDAPQEYQKLKTPDHKKKFILFSVIAIVIIAIASLGCFVIYPQVTRYIQQKENEDAAEKVMERIESAVDDKITLDSEKVLVHVKAEYNALTADQKALVKNYNKLEKACDTLDRLKTEQENQEKAQEIINAIESVDSANLTAEDTSVQSLREQYNSLTDDQKKLVTNADKLTEYENIVRQKAEEEAQARAINDMFANLTEYEGSWGDFGAHVNQYQGMVEAAIQASISLSGYFGGDVDDVYMYLYKVVDYDEILLYGANSIYQHYMIRFEGLNPNENGPYRTLECRVDSPDGINLVFTEEMYY